MKWFDQKKTKKIELFKNMNELCDVQDQSSLDMIRDISRNNYYYNLPLMYN